MARQPARKDDDRLRRLRKNALIIVGVVLVAAALYWIGSAFLPRWWAHRVGDQVHGSIVAGTIVGLFYGFVFTCLPLFVAWIGFRRRRPWRWWVAFGAAAIVLATPNLLTLGIVLGSGNASHAGERTLDVHAPAYRTSVLVGAILAAVATVALAYLVLSRKHSRGRVGKLLERLKIAEAEPARPAAPEPPAPPKPPA
jgi:ABC-type Fe3+ transport system permease subunit